MKKPLCFLLAVTLLAALAVPASAASMDDVLADITLVVKETADVSDDYTDFSGNWDDYLGGRWELYWSGGIGSLSVTADADGKILDYWCYSDADSSDRFYGFDAQFPALDEAEAEKTAQERLSRFMGADETAHIETARTELDDGSYRYGGRVWMFGVESPVTFSMVLLGDGTLRSYSRSDSYDRYAGDIPSAEAAVKQSAAAEALAETVAMELYWVSDGEGKAALRYVPAFARHIVDAENGECVDMDARYAAFNEIGYGPDTVAMATEAAAMDTGAGNGLTEVELASVQGYAEAMEAAELDARLRELDELGLSDGFELLGARYSQDADGAIYCDLTYTKTMTDDQLYGYSLENYNEWLSYGEELIIRKYIRMDAKTGVLQSVSTGYPLWERDSTADEGDTQSVAEAFLQSAAPDEFAASALCTLSDWDDGTVWAQREKGYFYPENRLTVTVNAASGAVDEYDRVWEDVSFGTAKPVAEQKAIEAYIDALDVTLGYAAWPVSVNDRADYADYADYYGYSWVAELKLAWYYSGTDAVAGVDAVGGTVIPASPEGAGYVYSDLDGCAAAEAIERLAAAGIGFDGGFFRPDEPLDMRTAAVLLLQADGYDPADWDDARLGEFFADAGMIQAERWNPDAAVSRMDFLKMLLSASRYGDVCDLAGVWQTDYEDQAVVAKGDMGYAAVAQALGLVTDAQLKPSAVCTRAMAAEMLCAFLQRG